MNILIIDQFKHSHQMISECIPRIGETVNLFFEPPPKVTNVMWFPPGSITEYYNAGGCDAVVFVE